MSTRVEEYVDSLWWLFILQGIATILFGIVALFFPGLTVASLLLAFAVYAMVIGIVELVHGFRDIGKNGSWWFSLIIGVALVGVGVYLVRNPLTALNVFLVLVGAIVLARGVVDLFIAAFFTGKNEHRWLWAISGVLGVIAGIIIWRYPASSGLAFVWVLGFYAVMAGSISLAYAFKVRDAYNDLKSSSSPLVRLTKK